MEQLTLSEQDLINAVCFFHSKFKSVEPQDVEVELVFDDETGYGAEAYVSGSREVYSATTFITAIRYFLDNELQKDSMSAAISLDIDDEEGMIAKISW